MATTKLYKWLPMMILISAVSYAQPSNRDVWNNDIFKKRKQGPVTEREGTTRYPDGRMERRNDRFPDRDRNYQDCHQCCNRCDMPPGQAKKKYGGNARDYAHGKKKCKNHGNRNRNDDDDDDDNNRQVRRYPQTNPQYPSAPQNPRNGQKYPSGKNRSL
jgi:hypothetical protein